MRVILCGGGTAGHVSPAIAIAEELRLIDKKCEILFIGRDGGRENTAVTKSGIRLETIKVQGLIRSLKIENIKRIITAIEAKNQAKKIIQEFKPDVVMGTGGYVCWPVISAAKSLGYPVAIHESNVFPGLSTKLVARKCDLVFLNKEQTRAYLSAKTKTIVVGNPLKSEFLNTTRTEARLRLGLRNDEIFIISFGGSGGAQIINDLMIAVIKEYSSNEKNIRHIHATGEKYYSDLSDIDRGYNKNNCRILSYINDMSTMIKAADIAICRSGAMTISELCEGGVCSILIPSPNVTDNHQYKNARILSDIGAAILIEEKNLSKEVLINAINELKNDKNGRKKRAKIMKSLSTPNSAKEIVKELQMLKNGIK
jgi:UDP-N-acetylglucosamine--N-acetylmuramyl-(pentapeptide) pyrophosphoryl-undecaprenol N-acetylglucosamine transferase